MKSRRKFTKEFKLTAIRRLQSGQSPAEVARALEVHPTELYRWRRELEDHGERAFSGVGKKRAEESRVAELERKVGQQALEIDFLKRALQHVEEQRLLRALNNGAPSRQVEKEVTTHTRLSVGQMCQLAQVSRAGYYRFLDPAKPAAEDLDLRQEMHQIALQWSIYGSRRMAKELQARGWMVNRKRVQRLMREDNLLCVGKRKFVLTTDSAHSLTVYPNLAGSLQLTGVDQLWVADITYIRLEEEFVYLAVILDAYSRRVIGWHVDDTLACSLTLIALRMALSHRPVRSGLVHHSDRGVQYASGEYSQLLRDRHIQISMSRKGNPWDNAACESFMKTLKYEEVYRTQYRNLADARARIGRFLEDVYNQKRLHSALQYLAPNEFERRLAPPASGQEAA